jgi:hypothetical protein
MFFADIGRICENCRTYNAESTEWYWRATRLQEFVNERKAEIEVKRLSPE